MGSLGEGIPPFPEVALWFISVDTEMNEKTRNCVFGMFVLYKAFLKKGFWFPKNFTKNKKTHRVNRQKFTL